MTAPAPDEALRAWFLGPRAENADLFERLILESLRDHVFWRRNHHPEDGFTIHESDRRRPGYDDAIAIVPQRTEKSRRVIGRGWKGLVPTSCTRTCRLATTTFSKCTSV